MTCIFLDKATFLKEDLIWEKIICLSQYHNILNNKQVLLQ
uniref:Uncharacterized protein n=1 Tax=Anguilla anguilla TaxID=7936 RepID=A0A0E9TYX6_ANGAN